MKILEIHIGQYGKFTEYRMQFREGINVITGENEAGKSTILSFLSAMLFGLEHVRGRGAAKDELSVRRPWEAGSRMNGSMRFEVGGKRYYLERDFLSRGKNDRLYCETDGMALPVTETLQELFGGINREEYEHTLCFERGKETSADELISGIQKDMVSRMAGGNGAVDLAGAAKRLERRRKELEGKKKKLLAFKDAQRRAALEKKRDLEQDASDYEAARKETAAELRRLVKEGNGEGTDGEKGRGLRSFFRILAAAAAAGSGLAALLAEQREMRSAGAVVLAVFCLLMLLVSGRKKKSEGERGAVPAGENAAGSDGMEHKRERLKEQLYYLENLLEENIGKRQKLEERITELQEADPGSEKLDEELSALVLAENTLKTVMQEIYEEASGEFYDLTAELLSMISRGRYTAVTLNEQLEVQIRMNNRNVGLHQVSRGTMEQILFAVRIAAAVTMQETEELPILLDETFAFYDDQRLERILEWLYGCGRQVVLFSCQKREKELLEKICSRQ